MEQAEEGDHANIIYAMNQSADSHDGWYGVHWIVWCVMDSMVCAGTFV